MSDDTTAGSNANDTVEGGVAESQPTTSESQPTTDETTSNNQPAETQEQPEPVEDELVLDDPLPAEIAGWDGPKTEDLLGDGGDYSNIGASHG